MSYVSGIVCISCFILYFTSSCKYSCRLFSHAVYCFASRTQRYRENFNMKSIHQTRSQLMLCFCLLTKTTTPPQHFKEVNVPETFIRLYRKKTLKVKNFKPLACSKEHFPSKQYIYTIFMYMLSPIHMAQSRLYWDWQ